MNAYPPILSLDHYHQPLVKLMTVIGQSYKIYVMFFFLIALPSCFLMVIAYPFYNVLPLFTRHGKNYRVINLKY